MWFVFSPNLESLRSAVLVPYRFWAHFFFSSIEFGVFRFVLNFFCIILKKTLIFDTLEPSREILCCVHFAVFFFFLDLI